MLAFRVGDVDPAIGLIKRKLAVFPVDDVYDERLAQRVRGFQSVFKLPMTGVLDEATAKAAGVEGFLADVGPR